MRQQKICVIYDTSYLSGPCQSIRKFIRSHRFSSQKKQGLLASLPSLLAGKGRGAHAVQHEPDELCMISEVIPTEVIQEVAAPSAGLNQMQEAVAALLADGAVKVDLAMDTVAGDPPAKGPQGATFARDTDTQRLILYAGRLISFATKEKYDLAIIATDDEGLLSKLAEMAKGGKGVLGLKSTDITGTQLLQDKLVELVNRNRENPITMEKPTAATNG
jgi:hypothetical protein